MCRSDTSSAGLGSPTSTIWGVTSASSSNASAPGTRTPCAATRTTASRSVYHMSVGLDVPVDHHCAGAGRRPGRRVRSRPLMQRDRRREAAPRWDCRKSCSTCSPAWAPTACWRASSTLRTRERMILSGTIYSAEELHELGLVDVLAEDGHGEEAVRHYIARNARAHGRSAASARARRRINPLVIGGAAGYRRHLGRDRAASSTRPTCARWNA